jgi:hypothetical protein
VITFSELWDLGLGLGDAWVTLGSPKGHPSVAQARPKDRCAVLSLFSTKGAKRRGGVEEMSDLANRKA